MEIPLGHIDRFLPLKKVTQSISNCSSYKVLTIKGAFCLRIVHDFLEIRDHLYTTNMEEKISCLVESLDFVISLKILHQSYIMKKQRVTIEL